MRHAEGIRNAELARMAPVLERLPEQDRRRVELLTFAMQKKLLHRPIMLLRESAIGGDGTEASKVVSDLFGLDLAAPAQVGENLTPLEGVTRLTGDESPVSSWSMKGGTARCPFAGDGAS